MPSQDSLSSSTTNQQCIGLQRDDMSLGARVEKPKLSIYVVLVASLLISSWGCDSSSENGSGEAGAEAGTNAGAEAGTDAGTEAGTDAGTEAGTDAGTEAGIEAGVEIEIEEPLAPEVPIIRRVLAYINRQDGGLGLQIDGRDEDNNVKGFTLEYFFDDGEPLVVVEGGGPIALEFNELRQGNGDFVGYWTIPFLLDINVDLLRLSEARLTVFDEDENSSPEKTIILLDTPTVPDGEECDLNRGLSRCGEESLCETAAGGRTTCGQAVIECPEYYNVIDLNVEGGTYQGDTTGQATYGVGTCGGGSASQVFSFTADAAGSYTFLAEPTGVSPGFMGAPDTLMWIRSHCRFSDWVAELGCNDDVNTANQDLRSIINLELEANQTVFVFIDGYSRDGEIGWTGPFILGVSQD